MIEAVRNLKTGDLLRLPDGAGEVLFGAEEIAARVAELGSQITADYQGKIPVLVAILRGGFIFQCDLARQISVPQELDFLAVSRFNPQERGRTAVKVLHDLRSDIRGRDVLFAGLGILLALRFYRIIGNRPATYVQAGD